MKFRIKEIRRIGFFAQVKLGLLSEWRTIGQHPKGYGLYSKDHIDYPLQNTRRATDLCYAYKVWARQRKTKAQYTPVPERVL